MTRCRIMKSVRLNLYSLVGYLLLTLIMTYPLVLNFNKAIPGDGFDGWQNYWNLWWVKRALVDLGENPFFTNYLYYPTGVSLYFHTLNIFNGLLTLPLQSLFSLTVAYNVVVLFSFVVAGYGTYLLVLYLLRAWEKGGTEATESQVSTLLNLPTSKLVAFVAGLVYTFSPFHFAHLLGHMQVFSLEWLPFYALALIRGFDRLGDFDLGMQEARGQRSASGIWPLLAAIWPAALFLILATLCDWYNALYLSLFTALYLGYLGYKVYAKGFNPFIYLRRPLLIAWGIGLAFALVLWPLLWPMLQEASKADYMVPDPQHTLLLSADLLAFVTPNEMHPLWGEKVRAWSERFTGPISERTVFAGYTALFLAALGLWKRRACTGFWALSSLIFAVFSLGPILHVEGRSTFTVFQTTVPLPYLVLYYLFPFAKIARSVSRFDAMVMLSLAVLVGFGLEPVLARLGNQCKKSAVYIRITLSALAAAIICFEFLAIPYPISAPDTPAFYLALAQEKDDYAVLNLPMDWDRPNCLLYQTVHGKRLTSAYTSRDNPRSIVERTPVLQHFRYLGPDIIAQDIGLIGLSVLNHLRVHYVIIDLYQLPDEGEREANLALAKKIFNGVPLLYQDERLLVYSVDETAERHPFLTLGRNWGPSEVEDGGPLRWLRGEATLSAYAPEPEKIRLKLTARSREGGHRLEVYVNNRWVSSHEIKSEFQEFTTPSLSLVQGENVIRLHSIEAKEGEGTVELAFSALDVIPP